MEKRLMMLAVVSMAMSMAVGGCSRESREEAMDRVAAAGRALNGGDTAE